MAPFCRYCLRKKCKSEPPCIYVMETKKLSIKLKPGKVSKAAEGFLFISSLVCISERRHNFGTYYFISTVLELTAFSGTGYVTPVWTRSMRMLVISDTLWIARSEGTFGKDKKNKVFIQLYQMYPLKELLKCYEEFLPIKTEVPTGDYL